MNLKEYIKQQPIEMQIALYLNRARDVAGLTQSQLAKKCGLRQEAISRAESGAHLPTLRTIEKILRECDVDQILINIPNPLTKYLW